MTSEDLPLLDRWLREPHVARWWLSCTTLEDELNTLRSRIDGDSDPATRLLIVAENRGQGPESPTPIGWCQWYPYDAYPAEASAIGAHPGDCGIDYAIGNAQAIGRGLGSQLIAALVLEVRHHHPQCGIVVDPEARNTASRRVLERNGFSLLGVRSVATEPGDSPMAIYRLSQPTGPC